MPSRWLALAIVAFWLGTNGWLFYTEIWPTLRPGQPPPLTIDLIQEARKSEEFIYWGVTQNDRLVFYAKTSIRRLGPDDFEMAADYNRRPGHEPARLLGLAHVRHMRSQYRVTSNGNLLAIGVTVDGSLLKGGVGDFTTTITGEVRSGRITPHLRLEGGGRILEKDLPTVEVPTRGSVLLPLHPVDRVRGLRPGQTWSIPVLDPLEDSLAQLPGFGGGPRILSARVSSEPEELIWNRQIVSCLVIDYQGGDIKARTWVEEGSGRVLRQEAHVDSGRWAMQRD